MKKLLTLLTTFVLALTMNIVVFAQTSNGKITVTNPSAGVDYQIYKIFDLTYSGSKVSYTVDENWTDFFTTGAGAKYLLDNTSENKSLNPITFGGATKRINITESNKEVFAKEALEYIANTDSIVADKNEVADKDDTSIVFSELPLGYYLVYPKGASTLIAGNTTIITLTSTLNEANINAKGILPTIAKDVDDTSVEVGQKVGFTITSKVPLTTGYNKYNFIIHDTWTEGLEKPASEDDYAFTVTFGETNIELTNQNVKYEDTTNGFTLTFDMTKFQDYVGQEITVSYKLIANKKAVNTESTNTVELEYSNNPKKSSDTTTTPGVTVKVYSSSITVFKYNLNEEGAKLPLAGAKFVLYKLSGNDKLYYQAKDADGNVMTELQDTSAVVTVDWTKDINDATVLVTTVSDPANEETDAILVFAGIENGTYFIRETEAPDGFNKLAKDVKVAVGEVEGTIKTDIAENKNIEIENLTGSQLPSTGGIGTRIFIITGAVFTVISAALLITNKKFSKED